MSFRITTNGLFRNYQSNLHKNTKTLNNSMLRVETGRQFNSYAEDPVAASKAFQLRRDYWRTGDQIDTANTVISKYDTAYSAMASIVDGNSDHPGLDGLLATIEAVSDTAGSGRVSLGQQLVSTAESVVAMMNSKLGEDYLFAGADGANLPFEWSADGTKLLYRGVDVSLEEPKAPSEFGLTDDVLEQYDLKAEDLQSVTMEKPLSLEEFVGSDGYDATSGVSDEAQYAAYQADYMTRNGAGSNAEVVVSSFAEAQSIYSRIDAFQKYASSYGTNNSVSYAQGVKDYAKLQKMSGEATYVDIGLGLIEDENGLIEASAFNSSISGLDFLGYGKDQNLAVIMKELGTIFANADPNTGAYAQDGDKERAYELYDQLHKAIDNAQIVHVRLSTDANYLKTNLNQLEETKLNLNEQIEEIEQGDPAAAITEMSWAQYCYNAALRIGNSILSQSLFDYMS